MTIVVAVNWFNQLVVLADTRISWKDNSNPPKDILRKIYSISDPGGKRFGVIGFSCDNLLGAQKVINYLFEKKLQNFSRPLVFPEFKEYLTQWIEEISTSSLSQEERKNLSFIFCGLEPSRSPKIRGRTSIFSIKNFSEVHIYVFRVNKQNGSVSVGKNQRVAIIGSGKIHSRKISAQINNLMNFAQKHPDLRWGRAYILSLIVTDIFKENPSNSVGGPIEWFSITSEDSSPLHFFKWPNGIDDNELKVTSNNSIVKLSKDSEKKVYELFPIWKIKL